MPCSVCHHPARDAIDLELAQGGLNRRVAEAQGLTETSVRRHRANHLPATLLKAHEAREAARADDLLAQVKALLDRALAILSRAEEAGDHRTSLSAIREARGTLELLGRLTGELQGAQAVAIAHVEVETRAGQVVENLERFRAVLQKMADAGALPAPRIELVAANGQSAAEANRD